MTKLNSTADYYKSGEGSLGWELTVSNALYPLDSPCRKVLKKAASYGEFLYDDLSLFIPMESLRKVLEIEWNERLRHIMASPSLADEESEILRHFVEDLYKCEYLILMRRAG